jgi:hypothetical protein
VREGVPLDVIDCSNSRRADYDCEEEEIPATELSMSPGRENAESLRGRRLPGHLPETRAAILGTLGGPRANLGKPTC